jgi:PIN domain nuclease of toxin-antitoxin system
MGSMTNRFLLDTSILIWLESGPQHIGPKTKRILSGSDLYFSTISVAELAYKNALGKIEFDNSTPGVWQELGIVPVPFDLDCAFHFGRYSAQWVADPFDRQIIATASAHNLTLLTSDREILKQGFTWVFDATT